MAATGKRNELRADDRIFHLGLMHLSCDHVLLAPQDERRRINILQKRRGMIGKLRCRAGCCRRPKNWSATASSLSSGMPVPTHQPQHRRCMRAAGGLQISPSSTNPALTEQGRANVFRVIGRDDMQGVAPRLPSRSLGRQEDRDPSRWNDLWQRPRRCDEKTTEQARHSRSRPPAIRAGEQRLFQRSG